MAFDPEKSFEINPDGIAVRDDDGNQIFLLTAGADSPVGQVAPLYSKYYRTNGEIWEKTGAGNNDWQRLIRSSVLVDAILFDENGHVLVDENFNTLYGEV